MATLQLLNHRGNSIGFGCRGLGRINPLDVAFFSAFGKAKEARVGIRGVLQAQGQFFGNFLRSVVTVENKPHCIACLLAYFFSYFCLYGKKQPPVAHGLKSVI